MIIWSGNFLLDDTTIDDLSSKLKSNRDSYSNTENHFSSYYIHSDVRPEKVLRPLYKEITDHVLKQLTLSGRVDHWGETFWMQVYPSSNGHLRHKSGHDIHDHWTGNEAYSWVHFLRPVKKCFYFLIDGKKMYPEQQNAGDYIVFPPWALHGVDVNDGNQERVVIAGNLIMNSVTVNYRSGRQKISTCHKINHNVLVWETIDE